MGCQEFPVELRPRPRNYSYTTPEDTAMPATDRPLVSLQSNGLGRYYVRCRCLMTSPAVDGPDDLRALAACRREGWRLDRRDDGTYEPVCWRCVVRGR